MAILDGAHAILSSPPPSPLDDEDVIDGSEEEIESELSDSDLSAGDLSALEQLSAANRVSHLYAYITFSVACR